MRILVFGAGVIGCNLARNLFLAGKDVTLLARGAWAEEIQKNGLRIKDKFSPSMLPEKNVLFAFALSAGHRERDYIASIDLRKITIGQLSSAPSNEQLISQIFDGMKFKVVYQPNMGDYLLCHAAFVLPVAFACYKTGGDLKKVRQGTAYPVWQELEKDTGKYLEQA